MLTSIELDPILLADLDNLRPHLHNRIKHDILPLLAKSDKQKALKIDANLENYPETKLIDIMIENLIEKKCDKPGFIMNHPLLMSPLAKSHEHGR